MIDLEIVKKWSLEQIKKRDIVIVLIAINVVLFLLGGFINLIGLPFGFSGETKLASSFSEAWLYVPSNYLDFLKKPYTIISYQFLHYGVFHILSNMVILYYFGNMFIQLTHKKKLLSLYIYGGFFGALVFILAYSFNPVLAASSYTLVGASGSVMAILAAVATLIPNREVPLFGKWQVKFKWIAFFFVFINIISLSSPSAAGNYAHLGGLLFGYLFIIASKNGTDLSKSFNSVFDYIVGLFSFSKKPKVTYVNDRFKNKKVFKPNKNTPAKKDKENQEKVDAILDKISQSGYDKLSKAEKDFLFKNSKK